MHSSGGGQLGGHPGGSGQSGGQPSGGGQTGGHPDGQSGGHPSGGGQYGGHLGGGGQSGGHPGGGGQNGGQFGGHGSSPATRTIRCGPFPLPGFHGSETIFPCARYPSGTPDSPTDHDVATSGAPMHPAVATRCHAPSAPTVPSPPSVHVFGALPDCWRYWTVMCHWSAPFPHAPQYPHPKVP
jgi:hypothetical protein